MTRSSQARHVIDRRQDYFAKPEHRMRPDFRAPNDPRNVSARELAVAQAPAAYQPRPRYRGTRMNTIWDRLMRQLTVIGYSQAPKPIAPTCHHDARLCEATECCADESLNVPEEAK